MHTSKYTNAHTLLTPLWFYTKVSSQGPGKQAAYPVQGHSKGLVWPDWLAVPNWGLVEWHRGVNGDSEDRKR